MSRSGTALLAILIFTALVGWYAARPARPLPIPQPPRVLAQGRPQRLQAPAVKPATEARGELAAPRGGTIRAAARRAVRATTAPKRP